MKQAKNATQWLDRITEDQNIEDLDQVVDTPMNGFKRWFASRILSPSIKYGYYDSESGKVKLGSDNTKTAFSQTATASAAASTYTATRKCEVVYAGIRNATRNFTPQLTTVIGGVTVSHILIAGYASAATCCVIGGAGLGGSNNRIDGLAGPIPLETGDTVTITDGAFVAADDMDHHFIIRYIGEA